MISPLRVPQRRNGIADRRAVCFACGVCRNFVSFISENCAMFLPCIPTRTLHRLELCRSPRIVSAAPRERCDKGHLSFLQVVWKTAARGIRAAGRVMAGFKLGVCQPVRQKRPGVGVCRGCGRRYPNCLCKMPCLTPRELRGPPWAVGSIVLAIDLGNRRLEHGSRTIPAQRTKFVQLP